MASFPTWAAATLSAGLAVLNPGDLRAQDGPPTWHGAIRAMVAQHCAPCHQPGTAAPFALSTYDDVRRRRQQILRMVENRQMPPWLPNPAGPNGAPTPALKHSRRLPDATIATLRAWVAAGAPLGDPAASPPVPAAPVGTPDLGAPDLVLTMPEVTVAAEGPDRFRNLVLPIPIQQRHWVRAVRVGITSPAVHHAVLQLDQNQACRQLDAADDDPGFGGMDMGTSAPPGGYFIGWTPGKAAKPIGAGMAFAVGPGDDLVLQLHLTTRGKPEAVTATVALYYTEQAPTRWPATVGLAQESITIAAGDAAHTVRDRWVLPAPIELHGFYPHAHYLGTSFTLWARPPDTARVPLLHIPKWNFDWQDDYSLRQPVTLPAGTTLEMEVTYDNSAANPFQTSTPPVDVHYGFRSRDEMATLSLLAFPVNEGDRVALDEGMWRREVAKKPRDWFCRAALARVLIGSGRSRDALSHLQTALQVEPDAVDAWTLLATALVRLDDPNGAMRALGQALDIRPDHVDARSNLAQLLAATGKYAAAATEFEKAAALRPDHPPLWNNLASARLDAGDAAGALTAAQTALRLDDQYLMAWLNVGRIHAVRDERDPALKALARAAAMAPDHPGVGALRDALQQK